MALPSVTSLEAPPYSHPAIVGVASWTLVRDVTYAHHVKLDPQGEWDGQVDAPSLGQPKASGWNSPPRARASAASASGAT